MCPLAQPQGDTHLPRLELSRVRPGFGTSPGTIIQPTTQGTQGFLLASGEGGVGRLGGWSPPFQVSILPAHFTQHPPL